MVVIDLTPKSKFEQLMKGENPDKEPDILGFDMYQEACEKTAIYPGKGELGGVMYNALQICAEAGEVAGKVAKLYRDGLPPNFTNDDWIELVAKEVGDVLWHQAMLLKELGFSFEDAALINLVKLEQRLKNNTLKGSGDNR